ncbi:MCE family protein [Mycolicibacillus parakoreensis]|uniref:MlaD family protein n=1 Tax=Mycolicibacillus parakoreensis TaxID=1069221 RepID=A0ABY3TZW8_9MYCO|nr:MlaD family protein [Mycolicibacillus parakoreensis]MCV7316532.1 MCE family protein [Mycolicibacillus parakoreensis]ULN52757.1 MlaD family protein [Mycolicibacillus parakoreensis]HLR98355.1 MlaD family protein [Mycolicibacillus parakoreensis]
MRALRSVATVVAFAVIVAAAVGYIAGLGVRTGPPAARTELSMVVDNLNGLVTGSRVLLRGVPVGAVTAVHPTTGGVTIDFYVEAAHPIPVDTVVRLDNLSALGEAFIGLFPRTAGGPVLTDGQLLDTEMVHRPLSIADLAIALGRLLGQADPDRLSRIVDEADIGLADPDLVLPNLARAATLLRGEVAGLNGRGGELVDNIQTLLRNAGFVGPVLAGLGPQLGGIGVNMQQVLGNAMNLVLAGSPENLQRFSAYLNRIQTFFDTRAPDIKVLAETLLPNARATSDALTHFDTARVLDNLLVGMPADGTITLHVTAEPPG